MTDHSVIFDTIHVIYNETIWREPDSVGRLYPFKTVMRESGGSRQILNDKVYQQKDTIYVATANTDISTTDTQIRAPTNQWVPWVIIVGMVIVAIIILAIRIFLLR